MNSRQHSNYTESDYRELSRKGYTDQEIVKIWDRDVSQGKGPLHRSDTDGQLSDFCASLR